MIYLLLAILSSALVSVEMRLSSDKVRHNLGMLTVNYLMCVAVAACYTGLTRLFPAGTETVKTLAMGAVHGGLYLLSFVLFQNSVKKNGVVLSATFMKLGLLVPILLSLFLFGERPGMLQIIGFCIAVGAIVINNWNKDTVQMRMSAGLLLLLIAGGAGDAMAKVYEQWGSQLLAPQFLFYTFLTAFLLCVVLMLRKGQRVGTQELLYGLLIGVPNFFSARFLLLALEDVPAVIAYPSYSVATLLVVTLTGVLVFKERLRKRQWLALGLILVALVLLNV